MKHTPTPASRKPAMSNACPGRCWSGLAVAAAAVFVASATAVAQPGPPCAALPGHAKLRSALQAVVKEGKEANTGMGNQEWAAVVDRDGTVCAVVFSGPDRSAQWPGSRVIAAEKASTANALS